MIPGPITERKRARRSQRWLTHGPSRFMTMLGSRRNALRPTRTGLGRAPEARGNAAPALAEDYLHHVIKRDDTVQPAVGVDNGQWQQSVPGERGAHRIQIILGGLGDDTWGDYLSNAVVRWR